MVLLSRQDKIRRARVMLEKKGVTNSEFIRRDISDSWGRCLDDGLDPQGVPTKKSLTNHQLEGLLDENQYLLSLSLMEMQNLHRQIAGSNFIILFANHEGVILDNILDTSWPKEQAAEFNPGQKWNESVRGTNALGLSVATQKSATVHAGEHFFREDKGLTCAAVPIFNPHGHMVGVLDAASDCRSRQQHTLALVKMSCLTIENGLFHNCYSDKLIIGFHSRSEFLSTLHMGLIAFEENGAFISCNHAARYLLQGISLQPGVCFNNIFQAKENDFGNIMRSALQMFLSDVNGSAFAIKVVNSPYQGQWGSHLYFNGKHRRQETKDPLLVFSDPAVQKAQQTIRRAVALKAPILIQGETGTGKEVMARFAHAASGRDGEFIALNCAALPDGLVESELFGYQGGAFTGANSKGAEGLFQKAHGGTLFLDEIGEMSFQLQAKLLRFLDHWKVRPVGSVQGQVLDIQLISATNSNLQEAIANKQFRADLFYRINTVNVILPPLGERSDIEELIKTLLLRLDGSRSLSKAALDFLSSRRWPGNIRELKNILTRLQVTADRAEISLEDVKEGLMSSMEDEGTNQTRKSLFDHEVYLVEQTYKKLQGNVSAVARELKISRNKVYKILKNIESNRP